MRTILLVEDEPLLLSLLMDVFDEEGFEVIAAEDGANAISILEGTGTISVLLTDVRMPGVSGWAVGNAAKRARPDLPVFYMSGYPEDIPSDIAPNSFVSKPYRVVDLIKRIDDATCGKAAE